MMISPESYIASYIDGKDEESVLKEIKKLRREISQHKYDIKHSTWKMNPSFETQLGCTMMYLDEAIREYLSRFGNDEEHRRKVYTKADYRDAELVANMSRILRITYTKEYIADGAHKICEYTADFSVDPLVTFRCERNAGEVTLDDELFHAYQSLQDKITAIPGDVQYENLKVLRSKMLETREAKSIGGTWEGNEDEQRGVILEDLSGLYMGEWKRNYSVKTEGEYAIINPFDKFDMHGIFSWSLRIDYRNDLQYPDEDEPETGYDHKDPVQPFIIKGTNDEPYNMDDLRGILEFTDEENGYNEDAEDELF